MPTKAKHPVNKVNATGARNTAVRSNRVIAAQGGRGVAQPRANIEMRSGAYPTNVKGMQQVRILKVDSRMPTSLNKHVAVVGQRHEANAVRVVTGVLFLPLAAINFSKATDPGHARAKASNAALRRSGYRMSRLTDTAKPMRGRNAPTLRQGQVHKRRRNRTRRDAHGKYAGSY